MSFTCALVRYIATAPGEVKISGTPVEARQYRVNINTAGVPRLSLLPGIGQVTAQRIIEYRDEKGPFTDVSELGSVRGIGPKKLEAVRPFVTVGDGD